MIENETSMQDGLFLQNCSQDDKTPISTCNPATSISMTAYKNSISCGLTKTNLWLETKPGTHRAMQCETTMLKESHFKTSRDPKKTRWTFSQQGRVSGKLSCPCWRSFLGSELEVSAKMNKKLCKKFYMSEMCISTILQVIDTLFYDRRSLRLLSSFAVLLHTSDCQSLWARTNNLRFEREQWVSGKAQGLMIHCMYVDNAKKKMFLFIFINL